MPEADLLWRTISRARAILIILPAILIIIGLAVLVSGAHLLVEGAVDLSERYGISKLIVGLSLVAFGTSVPEFFVNIISAVKNQSEINLGSIVGSNICNIALIIGISVILSPLAVDRKIITKNILFFILAPVLFLIAGFWNSQIGRIDAFIFLICFVFFTYYLVKSAVNDYQNFKIARKIPAGTDWAGGKEKSGYKIFFYIISGILLLWFGGEVTVRNSVDFAKMLGIPISLIAIVVIAGGTSLPELVSSIVAWKKKHKGIALGNILGSNVFNIFFVLGTAGLISPLKIYRWFFIDGLIMFSITLIFVGFMFFKKEKILARKEGIFFLTSYIGYITYVILRR